jgi:hypothetical protein
MRLPTMIRRSGLSSETLNREICPHHGHNCPFWGLDLKRKETNPVG